MPRGQWSVAIFNSLPGLTEDVSGRYIGSTSLLLRRGRSRLGQFRGTTTIIYVGRLANNPKRLSIHRARLSWIYMRNLIFSSVVVPGLSCGCSSSRCFSATSRCRHQQLLGLPTKSRKETMSDRQYSRFKLEFLSVVVCLFYFLFGNSIFVENGPKQYSHNTWTRWRR